MIKVVYHLLPHAKSSVMALNDLVVPSHRSNACIKHIVVILKPILGRYSKRKYYISGSINIRIIEVSIITFIGYLLKSKNRKMINIHLPRDLIYVFIKLIKRNIKYYVTVHNDRKNFRLLHLISFWCSKMLVESTICVSNSVYDTMKRYIQNACVIENSVPIKEIEKYKNLDRTNDVIIIGRFVKQKNVFYMKQVIDELPLDTRVTWVGSGIQKEKIKKLDHNKRITFYENLSRGEIYELLGDSKCYVCLSLWEGVGVASLEAIAAGCNIVLSDIEPHKAMSEVADIELVKLSTEVTQVADLIQKSVTKYEHKTLDEKFISRFNNETMIMKYNALYDK